MPGTNPSFIGHCRDSTLAVACDVYEKETTNEPPAHNLCAPVIRNCLQTTPPVLRFTPHEASPPFTPNQEGAEVRKRRNAIPYRDIRRSKYRFSPLPEPTLITLNCRLRSTSKTPGPLSPHFKKVARGIFSFTPTGADKG